MHEMSTGSGTVVECPLCGCFSPNLTLHVSHLRLVHSSDPSFNIVCSIRGCAHTETFRAFAAYNSHVYRHHRIALGLETVLDSSDVIPSAGPSTVCEADTFLPVNALNIGHGNDDDQDTAAREMALVPTGPQSDSGPSSQTTRAARFLLHLREGHRISQVALTDVMDTCNVMCTHIVNDLKQEVREKFVQANLDIDRIEGLEDVLSRPPPHPFEGVNTTYRFEKFCVDHLSCLVSCILFIVFRPVNVKTPKVFAS